MNRTQFAQLSATLALLLVLGTVLSYFLLLDMSTPNYLKESRQFDRVVDSCETAISKAERDYAKGDVKMYFGTGFDMDENRFPFTFYKRIEKQYGIEIIYLGDSPSPYLGCYNLKMDSLLSKKIGSNAIKNLYEEMRREQYPN